MKKILTFLCLICSILICYWSVWANCDYDPDAGWQNISAALNDCFNWDDSSLVTTDTIEIGWQNAWSVDLKVEWGFKYTVERMVRTIWWVLAVLAVWAIVYGSLLLVISGWEEEKLKKWKDVVKWAIVWFLWVVFAWVLITIVVNIMFSI